MSIVLRVSAHIYSKEIDGKTFIFRVNLGIWHLKSIVSEKQALLWGFQHTSLSFLRILMGNHSFFRVNLGKWPFKSIILEKRSTVLRVSTHIYGDFEENRWENIHFESKPRHVTFQIDCLRKMSTVLRVSAHIYSKEIDGKMFIFRVNLGIWHLKLIVLEKRALFWGFQHTFMGFFRR